MASALTDTWSGQDSSIAEIERELARLRGFILDGEQEASMRTSVMTHCAWVPPQWLDAAKATLEGMAERHPSRTILLVPKPDEPNGLDAELSVRCFTAGERHICGEVIELHLRGNRTLAPASIVLPLLLSDLPVFCRWRGEPAFGELPWEQLVGVVDRLVVDSTEWDGPHFGELAALFDVTVVSDLAWTRLHGWRVVLAACWPEIVQQEIHIAGPPTEAALLYGWLGSRLGRALAAPKAADRLSGPTRRRRARSSRPRGSLTERSPERGTRPPGARPRLRGSGHRRRSRLARSLRFPKPAERPEREEGDEREARTVGRRNLHWCAGDQAPRRVDDARQRIHDRATAWIQPWRRVKGT